MDMATSVIGITTLQLRRIHTEFFGIGTNSISLTCTLPERTRFLMGKHVKNAIALCVFHLSIQFCTSVYAVQVPFKVLNDGNKMPMIGLGTCVSKEDIKRMAEIIIWAIEAGYRHIDTAALYDDEEQIGDGIRQAIARGLVKREDMYVTTKLPWVGHHAREQVVPALKKSLSRLNLDYVDMYLVHQPYAEPKVDITETWKGMEDAKNLNLTKSIGVSNFNAKQIDKIIANTKTRPANNQIEVNPSETRQAMVSYCQQLGIVVTAYSPLGHMVPRSRERTNPPPSPGIDDPILTSIGQKYNKTTTQVVLRYLIDRDIIPLPLSTNKLHMQQNIDIFDFKLTPEELATVNQFNRDDGVLGWKLDAPENDEL